MKSFDDVPSDPVRELLRQGDPTGDGREPGADEVRLLRTRVLEEARQAPRREPHERFRPAIAVAWAALVCIGVLVAAGTVSLWRDLPSPGADTAATTATAPEEAAPRQVQFTTPGGTRIVWVLYPETP